MVAGTLTCYERETREALKEAKVTRDYRSDCGQILFHYGKGYGLAENLHSVCLGEEECINKILETGELPDDITPDERWALNYILNYRRENGYGEQPDTGTRETDLVGAGNDGTSRGKQEAISPLKKRKRFPLHTSHKKHYSLSKR